MTKLCKDCRYFKDENAERNPLSVGSNPTLHELFFKCTHKEAEYTFPVDLITGKQSGMAQSCNMMRRDHSSCGPQGKLWEPKPEQETELQKDIAALKSELEQVVERLKVLEARANN